MALKDIIRKILAKSDTEVRYEIEPSAFGVRFHSLQHDECVSGNAPTPLQLQYVTLQMLCEEGVAKKAKNGFFLPDDIASRISAEDRMLLGLPEPWPGRFELEVVGRSFTPSFRISLILVRPNQQRVKHYRLEGPFLIPGEGEQYLPDEAQLLALKAVKRHFGLAPDQKTEGANLAAIYALQRAQAKDVRIDLRHFEKTKVNQPDKVSVSIVENPDGSLRLIPDFGMPAAPEDIENRLGQLEGGESVSIRLGNDIILLNEKRLAAVQEILSNRQISAKEKAQFLKTPAAFLNASLVDLDNGLSIRVHGAEVFQKAYFGETDGQSQSWFGDPENEPDVIALDNACGFIADRKELDGLHKKVEEALTHGETSVPFKGKTLLLPATKKDIETIFDELSAKVSDRDDTETVPRSKTTQETTPPSEPPPNITVKIDLNEDEVAAGFLTLSAETSRLYSGPICIDGCKFKPFPYQKEGIRWLLGLSYEALRFPEKNRFAGALLADDMGLGKTFMTLAALQVYQNIMRDSGKLKPTLVVAPVVLLEIWRKQIDDIFENNPFEDIVILQANADLPRFRQDGAGRENKFCLNNNEATDSAIRYSLKIGKDFGNLRLDIPGRLVLTNYDTLRDYQFSLCMVDWGMIIFDEAQDIKNPNAMKSRTAKGLKADFRLAVTGTPVENSLVDFWSIFDTVSPGLLGSYKDFQKTYIAPINRANVEERNEIRIQVGKKLRSNVGSLMLRRTKEECLDCLPQKIIHDGGVNEKYKVMMHGLQKNRYDAVVASVAAARASGDPKKIQQAILPGLRRLRDVSLHPDLLEGGGPPVSSDPEKTKEILLKSEKLRLLLQILKKIREREEKVIIFVINKKLQRFLSISLNLIYGVQVDIVNGDTKSVASPSGRGVETRMQIIEGFESRLGFGIIIMSPLAAGVGLTVVGANNVVHLERHWNPAKEEQATDRVYRIGAVKDVHVYIPILIHPELKSFDSNLQALLARKVDLKDAVISPTEVAPMDFDVEGMFGGSIPSTSVLTPDWLEGMDWQLFEALTAELAEREFGGNIFLTPITGDFGADVVIMSNKVNVLIQCKCTINSLDDAKAVLEPYNARPEYEARLNTKFPKLILCTNAKKVGRKVFEKGKNCAVSIWTGEDVEAMLKKYKVTYDSVVRRKTAERIVL